MKDSIILAGNAAKNFLRRDLLIDTKEQYMKELNALVGYAGNNLLRELWLNIKGWFMKESNTLVGNAVNNFLRREI